MPKKIAMKKINILVAALAALLISGSAAAQNMYVSTNLLDYFNLGTINGEFGLNPLPKWSFYARGRYNPFTFNIDGQKQGCRLVFRGKVLVLVYQQRVVSQFAYRRFIVQYGWSI